MGSDDRIEMGGRKKGNIFIIIVSGKKQINE
jgi:hypothetical protein